MTLEEKFGESIEGWINHCRAAYIQVDSSSEAVCDCEAYKQIVSLGYKALPLIREVYERTNSENLALSIIQEYGLVFAVAEIVGEDFSIPENVQGKFEGVNHYTKEWLDENMFKYIHL